MRKQHGFCLLIVLKQSQHLPDGWLHLSNVSGLIVTGKNIAPQLSLYRRVLRL